MKRLIISLVVLFAFILGAEAQTLIKLGATPASSASFRAWVVLAYEKIACKVEVVEVPAERARVLLEAGELDAIMYERPEVASTLKSGLSVGMLDKPLFVFSGFAYIRIEDSSTIKTLADLKGKNIAYIRQLRMDSYVKSLGGVGIEAETVENAIKMLMAKRFDALLASENSLTDPIKRAGYTGKIFEIKEPVYSSQYFHILHKKHSLLKDALSKEFKRTEPALRKLMGL